MRKIDKIDQFNQAFPIKYGLDADGACYEVQGDLFIEALLNYEEHDSPAYGKYLEPIWTKILANIGDLILSSKNGTFIKFQDHIGFVECKPVQDTKPGEPPMLRFPKESLKKIGNDLMSSNPMSLEERELIKTERSSI